MRGGTCFAGTTESQINGIMDHETRWLKRYQEVVDFIKENHRNPSKYVGEERELVNWVKQQRKLVNAGELKPGRVELFNKLLELSEKFKRVNQWG